jgi:hypothetical protein
MQLYDLTSDIGEKRNVVNENGEVAGRLTKLLEKYIADGRSTPGMPQKNDRSIELRRKSER